jgi:hypothetical protein
MAESINFPLANIYKANDSLRTGHSKAAVAGFLKSKKIIIFDSLLAGHEKNVNPKLTNSSQ